MTSQEMQALLRSGVEFWEGPDETLQFNYERHIETWAFSATSYLWERTGFITKL